MGVGVSLGVLAWGGEGGAVCPHLDASADAYARSTIAFVGHVIATPAEDDEEVRLARPVKRGATLADTCPAQARWSPAPGEACVIGVVTAGSARIALGEHHTIATSLGPVEISGDGCFAVCGPPDPSVAVSLDRLDFSAVIPADAEDDPSARIDVTTRRRRYLAPPIQRLHAGEVRFVIVDRSRLRAHRLPVEHSTMTWWEWHAIDEGGLQPHGPLAITLEVDTAWKGVCPHDRIVVESTLPLACQRVLPAAPSAPGDPPEHVMVFGSIDRRGLVGVEGQTLLPGAFALDDVRPAGATDLHCQR
jgi:hypothetical protein